MAKIQAFYSKNAVLGGPGGEVQHCFPRFGRFGPERVRKSIRDFQRALLVAVL